MQQIRQQLYLWLRRQPDIHQRSAGERRNSTMMKKADWPDATNKRQETTYDYDKLNDLLEILSGRKGETSEKDGRI